MDTSNGMEYLTGLNERQKEAVLHIKGPLLIVAGAGAGKTKTITHRAAYMIESGIPAHSILAVTFTNKAAVEMRNRIAALLPPNEGGSAVPFTTTFHSLGVRILREFAGVAGIPRSFVIWDRDDSIRALKRVLVAAGLENRFPPRQVLARISREKGNGLTAETFLEQASSFYTQSIAEAWIGYEAALKQEGALDFDDLLVRTLALLRKSPETLAKLQHRWQHVTIDEYQDTNQAQYEIAKLLTGEKNNICVVGDMDQCLIAGTSVTMADGTVRPIETMRTNDMVLSNYGSGDTRPARVMRVRKRAQSGNLIRITTRNGRVLTSTPEHIHFAGYRLGVVPQMYFTYLMHKRGMGWRLGVSQTYTKGQQKPMIGFQQRCNHEHADEVWIVKTHSAPQDARVLEYQLSLKYGIPTIPFVARKGTSQNGYVHDQKTIEAIFRGIDTESAAQRLLLEYGLSYMHPHHRAQATRSDRRNIMVTLCGDHRGVTPMHRISMMGSDAEGKKVLLRTGFSVRPSKSGSRSWRFETAYKDYAAAHTLVTRLQSLFPDAHVIETARLGGKKQNTKDGNSLPFLPAGSVLPGMALFNKDGGYDIVEYVEKIPAQNTLVYDLDVEHTHNFIANGIVTHNCIYSWRGADIAHLLAFEKTFPGTKTVLLEENYRSTQTILTAANAVIAKNTRRFDKRLTTMNPTGEAITLFAGESDRDEAFFVARSVRELLGSGVKASEIAVLFRENFQSRALEEAFISLGLPYRVLGVRFFDRAEVKDALAYLRGALNPASFTDFSRAAGVPPRGIGKTTLEKIATGKEGALAATARGKIANFRSVLERIRTAIQTMNASEAVRFMLKTSGLEEMLAEGSEEERERLNNIFELVAHSVRYDSLPAPEGIERLLEDAALMGEQDALDLPAGQAGKRQEAVSLMTVHASKGLEFDAVFITGMEHGLFPSERLTGQGESDEERDNEEERRLFYVAITRARTFLYLTLAGSRLRYGSRETTIPSSFLEDIDPRLIAYADEGMLGDARVIR